MELQSDVSVEGSGCWIGEIHNYYAIESRYVVVSFHHEQEVVPVVGPDYHLVFRRRPDYPLPPIPVQAARMVCDLPVDFKLQALSDSRSSRLELRVKENAAVAIRLALESEREMEIDVFLLGSEITVLFRDPLTVNRPILDFPLLLADLYPAREVFPVEKGFPARAWRRRLFPSLLSEGR